MRDYPQQKNWLKALRSFSQTQNEIFSHFMITEIAVDQQHFLQKLTAYKNSGMLNFRQFREIKEIFKRCSLLFDIVLNIKNYKDKFENLLTEEYQDAYTDIINALLDRSYLDKTKYGVGIMNYLDKKRQKLESQLPGILTAIETVKTRILDLWKKFSPEIKEECEEMERSYNQDLGSKKKDTIRKTFANFRANYDHFLHSVGENLSKLCDELLSPIFLFLFDELHGLPSELCAKAGLPHQLSYILAPDSPESVRARK